MMFERISFMEWMEMTWVFAYLISGFVWMIEAIILKKFDFDKYYREVRK